MTGRIGEQVWVPVSAADAVTREKGTRFAIRYVGQVWDTTVVRAGIDDEGQPFLQVVLVRPNDVEE